MFKSRSPRLTDGQRMLGLAGIGVGGARPAVRWSPRRKFVGYVAVRSEAANYDANFGGGGAEGGGQACGPAHAQSALPAVVGPGNLRNRRRNRRRIQSVARGRASPRRYR